MSDHSFRREGYALGGHAADASPKRRRVFLPATAEPIPYSDRKAMGGTVDRWPLANVVYAQCRAAGVSAYDAMTAAKMDRDEHGNVVPLSENVSREPGVASIDTIAREMGVPSYAVAKVLNPEPKAERQARAGVKRPAMKPARRGFF